MKISLIVPVQNDGPRLKEIATKLVQLDYSMQIEWLFINCSRDNDSSSLSELQSLPNVCLIQDKGILDYGAALATGIERATGDYILIQDTELDHLQHDIAELLSPIKSNHADAVVSTYSNSTPGEVSRTSNYLFGQLITSLNSMISGLYLSNIEPSFLLIRSDLLKSMLLTSKDFEVKVEIAAYLAKTDSRIFQIPTERAPRARLTGKSSSLRTLFSTIKSIIYFNKFVSEEKAFKQLPNRYVKKSNYTEYYSSI